MNTQPTQMRKFQVILGSLICFLSMAQASMRRRRKHRVGAVDGGVLNSSTAKGTRVHEGSCHRVSPCIFVPFGGELRRCR